MLQRLSGRKCETITAPSPISQHINNVRLRPIGYSKPGDTYSVPERMRASANLGSNHPARSRCSSTGQAGLWLDQSRVVPTPSVIQLRHGVGMGMEYRHPTDGRFSLTGALKGCPPWSTPLLE